MTPDTPDTPDMNVPPADLPDFALNPNAEIVLKKRYLRKGQDGNPLESTREMFWRVARAIAAQEGNYPGSSLDTEDLARRFFEMMTSFRFLPNSPTLMNAGTDLGQLAACFVLPVGDSMEEIFDAIKYAALIHKSGGGTGFSFSRLRPQKSRVGSTGGIASGPISFLRIFNTATEQVKQGGTRRGANMGILRVDHPDILEFIRAKEREGELNNFNLSIALTEAFMQAVENDEEYSLIAPHTGNEKKRLKARDVFALLVHKAWESGDPGIIFLDRINRDNPTPGQGEIESTNPCGEQPLLPYEACNLGSINLARFHSPKKPDGIDWEELKNTVHLSVRFLDNVIDASIYPLEVITETVRNNRKIGLGVMGWADLLYQLRIPYNTQQALDLAEKVMQFIQAEARSSSKVLADERGPFPAYDESIYAERNLGPYRNATTTTIAPTGTLSIISGCSSGIEPLFALSFVRQVMDGERLVEANPHFEQALKDSQSFSPKLMEEVSAKGSIQHITYVPEEIRSVFVTAMDIEAVWHLKMQAAFQKFTDNAVSKTVNLPNKAALEDIRSIYWMAYELGCKGVTVYRDGCKSAQVLCTGDGEKKKEESAGETSKVMKRPDIVYGFTQKVRTGLGELYLTVNEVDGKPFEVFATIGRSGRSITAKAEAIGRLVSLALRSGVHVSEIVNQLKGIGGEHPVFQEKGLLLSIPDAVSWVLENRYMQGRKPNQPTNGLDTPLCPECDQPLIFQEGCHVCQSCGYTKCG
jgi:ribonucleoside-diphosphate reductase alpha chain